MPSSIPQTQVDYHAPSLTDFNLALNEFITAADGKHLSSKSCSSYKSYLIKLDTANSRQTLTWVKNAISVSSNYGDFVTNIRTTFDGFINSKPNAIPAGNQSDLKSAFIKFGVFCFSYFDATANILWARSIEDFELAQQIAETAIFATPETVKAVVEGKIGRKENCRKGNPYASWDNMSSIRNNKKRKQTIMLNGKQIYCDDNTRANYAIKSAILHGMGWPTLSNYSLFHGFEACHIYDKVSDPRYYTSIMNLTLVPRALAALTDHNDYVKSVLKYRVFELFGFSADEPAPQEPKNYDKINWK